MRLFHNPLIGRAYELQYFCARPLWVVRFFMFLINN